MLGISPVSDQAFEVMNHDGYLRDFILYSKVKPAKIDQLQGKVVAIRDPYTNKVIFRRVIATELFWIRRIDDMGLIQIPKSHVWVECESSDDDDSITKFGPITTSLVLG